MEPARLAELELPTEETQQAAKAALRQLPNKLPRKLELLVKRG